MTPSAPARHRIVIESNTEDGFLLVCPEQSCGRRLVIHRAGGMTVIDRGDVFAHHVGGNAGVDFSIG